MAAYNDTLYTKIIVDAQQAVQEMTKFASLGTNMGKIQAAGGDINHKFQQMKDTLGENSAAFKVMNKNMRDTITRSKEMATRFDMDVLSWTFGGMALQRMGMMMTRFFIPSMQQLVELNTVGAKKVQAVSAAFQFLKISLFETLTSLPLFNRFVELLVKAAIWISEFAQKHPAIVGMAAALSGIAVVLGTLALGVGIFGQLQHLGVLLGFGMTGLLTNTGMLGAVTKIASLLKKGFIFYLAFEGIKNFMEGGLENALGEILGIGITLLGGLGYGIPFYLAFKGMKHFLNFSTFEASILAGLGVLAYVMGGVVTIPFTLAFIGFVWAMKEFDKANKEAEAHIQWMNELGFQTGDYAGSLVTVGDKLANEFIPGLQYLNTTVVPETTASLSLMTTELLNVKAAIDAIPNETKKYVIIETIRKDSNQSTLGDRGLRSSEYDSGMRG